MTPLKGHVDLMVLRDVIERHRISNVEAPRRLQRHPLANPGGSFSASKFHRDLKPQTLAVGEKTLHHLLSHLKDTILVRLLSMHTTSKRQRMPNPRKAYPVDPGLIPVHERAGRENRRHSLDTAVLIELEHRGYDVAWMRVGADLEVNSLAEDPNTDPLPAQVPLDTAPEAT